MVKLNLPMEPGAAPPLRKLAAVVVKDSIIAQAAERLVVQIVQVCAEHEEEAVRSERLRRTALLAMLEKARPYIATAGTATDWARDVLIAEIDEALADAP